MENRERILKIMKNMIAKKGFVAVTTGELSAAAGISKRTLYQLFRSKEEIIGLLLEEVLQAADKKAEEIAKSSLSPPEKIKKITLTVAEEAHFLGPAGYSDLRRRYPRQREKLKNSHSARIRLIRQIYLEGCRQGCFRETDPEVLIASFTAAVRAAVAPGAFAGHEKTLPQVLDAITEIFLHGISFRQAPER